MDNTFGYKLNMLRKERGLTVQQVAKLSKVSQPLISNLLNNHRVIGEYTARKIGAALQLNGDDLEDFVYQAINLCTEKVPNSSKGYPSELINLVTNELNKLGIAPETITRCVRYLEGDSAVALCLVDGRSASINLEIAIR